MQRWHNLSGNRLQPGQAVQTADGRSLVVVRSVSDGPGSQELLAVGTYSSGRTEVEESGPESTGAGQANLPRVSGPLSLPYTLPE